MSLPGTVKEQPAVQLLQLFGPVHQQRNPWVFTLDLIPGLIFSASDTDGAVGSSYITVTDIIAFIYCHPFFAKKVETNVQF